MSHQRRLRLRVVSWNSQSQLGQRARRLLSMPATDLGERSGHPPLGGCRERHRALRRGGDHAVVPLRLVSRTRFAYAARRTLVIAAGMTAAVAVYDGPGSLLIDSFIFVAAASGVFSVYDSGNATDVGCGTNG